MVKDNGKKNFRKNFIWNIVGTMLNSFISLFFLVAITRINGVNDAGIFSFGFAVACLLFQIGIYFGRTFQVTENTKISDKSYFVSRIVTVVLMLAIAFIYSLTKSEDSFKFWVVLSLCGYKALEAFADVIYGFFQKYEDLYISGISLTLKNVIGFGLFLILDAVTGNMLIAILSMLLVHILVIIFYDFRKMQKYHVLHGHAEKSDLISIFKNGFFPFMLSFLSLLLVNSPKYAAESFTTNDIQTYLGIIMMPATIISLAAQFIVYPYLPIINTFIKEHKPAKVFKLTNRISLYVIGIGAICTLLAFLLGIPVLELVYGVSLSSYRGLLVLIMIGAIFNACVYVLSSALVALRKLKLQTFGYLIIAVLSFFLARLLVYHFSIDGACLSYLIANFVLCLFYFVLTIFTLKKNGKAHVSKA